MLSTMMQGSTNTNELTLFIIRQRAQQLSFIYTAYDTRKYVMLPLFFYSIHGLELHLVCLHLERRADSRALHIRTLPACAGTMILQQ